MTWEHEGMNLDQCLSDMVEKKGSDLFVMVGVPPMMKVHGELEPLGNEKLTAEETKRVVLSMMNEEQKIEFLAHKELNFAIASNESGRFRVSAFQQRSVIGAVLRRIETIIPTIEALGAPAILNELVLAQRGLIILVGATGAGKSSTLAAMIGYRNRNTKGHIISIEDPIEFVHAHQSCVVTQREVGIDTESFEVALKNTLRQAPDVILIGEIRSRETMNYAVAFAETGHLCLATLHANNANQALDRIANFFPHEMQQQLWLDLSLNLKAIIAQQLIPSKDGTARLPAVEILINTPVISEHIRKGDVSSLKGFMTKSRELGMQTFDQALYQLYAEDKITYEAALKHADSENEVRLMIKLEKGKDGLPSISGLSILKE
jgi:twitching motility protein PilU